MHKIKKIISIMLASIMTLTMAACVFAADSETVLRAEDIDDTQEISLTVNFLGEDDSPVSGAEVSIYRVADVYTEGYGVYYTALTGDYDYAGITSSQSNTIAKELAKDIDAIISAGCEYYTAKTSSSGKAAFTSLTRGIYLVVMDSSPDNNYFEPYLACAPQAEESDGLYVWDYSVVSYPKTTGVTEVETETETETSTDGGTKTTSDTTSTKIGIPTTGDTTIPVLLWVFLAVCAAAALVVCIKVTHKNKKQI